MYKKIAGFIGALTTLGATTAVTAAPTQAPVTDVMEVNSYADLLQPIPNVLALMQASDAKKAAETKPGVEDDSAKVELAQYHHHHHHHHWRRWHHHHHHWHHHHHHHY